MSGRRFAAFAVLLAIGQLAAAAARSFPEARPPLRPDGPVRIVPLPGSSSIRITPLRFDLRADVSQVSDGVGCGLTIAGQSIVTIGTGEREALSCDALGEIGQLPPGGGRQARIGLVYFTHSPNVPQKTAVVLVRSVRGRWTIDEPLTARLGDVSGTRTLAGIRRYLRRHRG